MEGPSQATESEYDSKSLHSNESKLRLKDAILHLEQLLLENDLMASESSKTISYEAMQMGEELYHSTVEMLGSKIFMETEELLLMHETDEEGCFHEVQEEVSDEYQLPEKTMKVTEYIPLDYKVKIVNMAKEHPKWSLKTLQKKGGLHLKSMSHLYRWEADIKRGGTTIDKYTTIDSWTYDRFLEARENNLQVTTRNLQEWALSAASQFPDFQFAASHTWLVCFKRKHRIRQRKITKYVTARETVTIQETLAAAEMFRKQTLLLIPQFNKDFIINTDQTGCQYQSTYDRTLTTQGAKTVFVQRQSINKITHSYTAQYAMTMSGKLLPLVFLCLQEATGIFGPRVQKTVDELTQKYKNIIVTSSKSGKLTTHLYIQFLKDALAPYVGQEKFLLLIDSWGGQTNPALYDEIFVDDEGIETCTIKVIPPKCTPLCQPCDVYFYRQVKNLIKRLQNCSALVQQKREISLREDCIKIHSLVHHQLSAPVFKNMLRYAWFASQLTTEREIFMNVNEVCFPNDVLKNPCNCKNAAFIRCARCYSNYCFTCFYDKYHPTECVVACTSRTE